MAIKVGLARAFVKSATPPTSIDPIENEQLKSLYWLQQTDPVNNPNLVITNRWSAQANNGTGGWIVIDEDEIVFVRELRTVASNGQTLFTLSNNVKNAHQTRVEIVGLPEQLYLEDFTITEDGVNYNPNTINNNQLNFLGTQYQLEVGEEIYITYQVH